jgi:predicted dehydrogenase
MGNEDIQYQKTINWGIIGCGNVTEVKSGPAFSKVSHSKLMAVMRRDAAKAADYAKRHNVPRWYSNASDLMDDPEINAIYIATPPKQHEEYALAALNRGKFVYIEKPVTTDVLSCSRMIEAVQKTKGKLVVAHYRRAVPMFQYIKRVVEDGRLGKIKSIQLRMFQPHNNELIASAEANWRVIPELSGGGYFYDLAPHQLDFLQFVFGTPIRYHGLAVHQSKYYPAEDVVSGMIEYPHDIIFNGQWHFDMPDSRKEDICLIIGEGGSIEFPFFGNTVKITTSFKDEIIPFEHPTHIQQPMIEKVVRYFLGEEENPCTVEEAMASLRVMENFVYSTTIIGP